MQNKTKIKLKIIIRDVEKLGKGIEQALAQLRLPSAITDYQANKLLIFPGLCLTPSHVYNSEEKLSWSQIEEIRIGPERVIITEKYASESWLDVSISQLPMYLLAEILPYIKREQALPSMRLT